MKSPPSPTACASSPHTRAPAAARACVWGEAPGDRASIIELVVRHGPILLVLFVACMNVATLIYARTATREWEIALRCGLGANRMRIITQLFIEALVLAGVSAAIGVAAAHWAVTWGVTAYYSSLSGGAPFWIEPGLKPATIVYAIVLAITGAAILGVLPAIKATGINVQAQLRNLAAGSTLRFGGVWTTAMIAQVAVTVICIPPAMGIGEEAWRDRRIRAQFPGHEHSPCASVSIKTWRPANRTPNSQCERITRTPSSNGDSRRKPASPRSRSPNSFQACMARSVRRGIRRRQDLNRFRYPILDLDGRAHVLRRFRSPDRGRTRLH